MDGLSGVIKTLNKGYDLYKRHGFDLEANIKEVAGECGIPFDTPIPLPNGFILELGLKTQPEALAGKQLVLTSGNKEERKKGKMTKQKGVTQEQTQREVSQIAWLMEHGGCLIGKVYWGEGTIHLGNLLLTFGTNGCVGFIQLVGSIQTIERVMAKSIKAVNAMQGNLLLQTAMKYILGSNMTSGTWYAWSDMPRVVEKLKYERKELARVREIAKKNKAEYEKVVRQQFKREIAGEYAEAMTFGLVKSEDVQKKVQQRYNNNSNRKRKGKKKH